MKIFSGLQLAWCIALGCLRTCMEYNTGNLSKLVLRQKQKPFISQGCPWKEKASQSCCSWLPGHFAESVALVLFQSSRKKKNIVHKTQCLRGPILLSLPPGTLELLQEVLGGSKWRLTHTAWRLSSLTQITTSHLHGLADNVKKKPRASLLVLVPSCYRLFSHCWVKRWRQSPSRPGCSLPAGLCMPGPSVPSLCLSFPTQGNTLSLPRYSLLLLWGSVLRFCSMALLEMVSFLFVPLVSQEQLDFFFLIY